MAELTLEQWQERLEQLGAGGLLRALRKPAIRTAEDAERESKLLATTRLRVRTGRLRSSIAGTAKTERDGFEVAVQAGGGRGGRPVRYARLQEEGGTVTAKRAKKLAIPTPLVLTAAGASRYASVRDYPRPLVFTSGTIRDAATGDILWWRKRSVSIRGKHYLRDGLRTAAARMPPLLRSVVSAEVTLGKS